MKRIVILSGCLILLLGLAGSLQAQSLSGYGQPFAADGSLTGRNVIVLKQDVPSDVVFPTRYFLRIRYDNTLNEPVSVNGVPTVYRQLAHYPFVKVDSLGNAGFISDHIDALNVDYSDIVQEQSEYDPETLVKTVTRDEVRELTLCFNDLVAEVLRHCVLGDLLSASGEIDNILGSTQVHSLLGVPISVNGLSFPDVRIESRVGNNPRIRARGKGIGVILDARPGQTLRKIIYYRLAGVTTGSLAGTPFAAGASLDGLFFTATP